MTTDSNLCTVCGKSKVADPASPDAHCQGHLLQANAAAKPTGERLKIQLGGNKAQQPGATPAAPASPEVAAATAQTAPAPAAKSPPPPVPAPKPSSSQQNLKAQLDGIATPAASPQSAPAPTPTPAEATQAAASALSLAEQLNAIPTPKVGAPLPTAEAPASASPVLKATLDSIPTPAAQVQGTPAQGLSFQDQLDSIPTPGVGSSSSSAALPGGRGTMDELNSIRTPGAGIPSQSAATNAETPQWMKNFATYQSSITSTPSGLVTTPESYTPTTRDMPQTNNSGYTVIAVLVVVIVLVFFAFTMMNKTPPANFDSPATTTGTSSKPGTTTKP